MNTAKNKSFPGGRTMGMPMGYPSERTNFPAKGKVIAADVGGTTTNLSLFDIKDGSLLVQKEETYSTRNFSSFIELLTTFHEKENCKIDSICLGVAGPVINGRAQGTNFPWAIDSKEIEKEFQIPSVFIINDMEANAYGLTALKEEDFYCLQEGSGISGNAVIISPGTGLGEAGLFWDGSRYFPFPTEGGHCDFSPRNDLDIALWQYLRNELDRISWERVVSGPSIYNIYKFLRQYMDDKEPQWLTDKIRDEDSPAVISSAALQNKDAVCTETLELFLKYLAIEASQLALKTKSMSGVYIGGGILPKILKLVKKDVFIEHFTRVGRLNHLLKEIPIHVVLNDKTALLGAANFAAMTIKKS